MLKRGQGGEIIIKIVFCGSVGCGKTSLIRQFQGEMFRNEHIPTVGINIENAMLKFKGADQQPDQFSVYLYEVSGVSASVSQLLNQESIGTFIFFFVFDVTRPETLEAIPAFLKWTGFDQQQHIGCLVANKVDDAAGARLVTREQASEMVMLHQLCLLETSAIYRDRSTDLLRQFVLYRGMQQLQQKPLPKPMDLFASSTLEDEDVEKRLLSEGKSKTCQCQLL